MKLFRPRAGSAWTGPAAIFDGEEVGFRHGAYALTPDGKSILTARGGPVRLVTVVDAEGKHSYEVAGKKDAPTRYHPDYSAKHSSRSVVDFEAESVNAGSVGI